MVKYLGPKVRIIRKFGILPGLTSKIPNHRYNTPGQHGKAIIIKKNRSSLSDDYKQKLTEKQKLCFNYGITDHQLFLYYKKARAKNGITGKLMLDFLERRLDCIIYRLGFAPSIYAARQIINHKHILVNNKIVNLANFLCSTNDIISISDKEKSNKLLITNFKEQERKRALLLSKIKEVNFAQFQFYNLLPKHLEFNKENFSARVILPIERNSIPFKINELKVAEYYFVFSK